MDAIGTWRPLTAVIQKGSCRLATALLASLVLHALAIYSVRAGNVGRHSVPQARVLLTQLTQAPVNSLPSTGILAEVSHNSTTSIPHATSPALEKAAGAALKNDTPAVAGSGTLPLDFQHLKTYRPASLLHQRPVARDPLVFDFPAGSIVNKGVVVARILISENGTVDDVIIEKAEPTGIFESNTMATLLRQRFSPGIFSGQPVPSQVLMEIQYENPNGDRSGGLITAERQP